MNVRLEGGLWSRPMASTLYRIVIGTALMGEAVTLLLLGLDAEGNFGPRSFFALVAGSAIGAVVYYVSALLLRLREAELIALRVQGLLSRGSADGHSRR